MAEQPASEPVAKRRRGLADPQTRIDLLVGGALTAVGATVSYALFDVPVAESIGAVARPFADVLSIVTDVGRTLLYIIVLPVLWLVCLLAGRRRIAAWVALLWTAAAAGGLVVQGFKYLLGRARPQLLLERGAEGWHWLEPTDVYNSMPSGHAQMIAILATFATLLIPRAWILWLVLGVALASTRVLTGMHYISDVLVGGYIGILAALASYELFRRCGWVNGSATTTTPSRLSPARR